MSKQNLPWGIHWFRRDLRVHGNEALLTNWRKTGGRTLGLFSFDSQFLKRDDFSHNRFAFFLNTLLEVKKEMQAQGGDLLVIDEMSHIAFQKLLKNSAFKFVTFNRDYEPYARSRDEKVLQLLQEGGVEVETFRDHLIFEPYEILKSDKPDDFYKVYTPFAKKWFKKMEAEGLPRTIKNFSGPFSMKWKEVSFPYHDALEIFIKENSKHVTVPIPEAGHQAALKKLNEFKTKIKNYKLDRDIPSLEGTSRFSIFLKNGSLVSSEVFHKLHLDQVKFSEDSGPTQFAKEIVWREFYYSILYHRPDVENSAFHKQYNNLKWDNNSKWFQRWQEGTTGFPIVDAGMRELLTTGWMHNRVRMIVASFLTKDLLINWQWGENHFMKYLLDGDLAPNNGGWQWAASTGCDPQPYFRVFNPWLQSEKFDPDGLYIKKFIPELKDAPAKVLHNPFTDRSAWKYPKPIVDHGAQRDKAISLYKKLAKSKV